MTHLHTLRRQWKDEKMNHTTPINFISKHQGFKKTRVAAYHVCVQKEHREYLTCECQAEEQNQKSGLQPGTSATAAVPSAARSKGTGCEHDQSRYRYNLTSPFVQVFFPIESIKSPVQSKTREVLHVRLNTGTKIATAIKRPVFLSRKYGKHSLCFHLCFNIMYSRVITID